MIKRDQYLNEIISKKHNGFIKVITGLRRSGKSFLLNTLFYDDLNKSGIKKDHIIKFAFDDSDDVDLLDAYYPEEKTRFKDENGYYVINSKKFRAYIKDKIVDDGMYYLLLDEIQLLDNFVGTLNGFLRHNNYDTYVTCSNSKLLTKDVLTEFRGRGDEIHVSPLSFKEFFEYKNVSFDEAWNEYVEFGGMPLAVLSNKEQKHNYLISLFKETYIRDIKDRNRIKNDGELEELLNVISSSVGSLTNPKKLVDTFKSEKGISISPNTIKSYLDYLCDAYLIKEAFRYDIKGKKYINTPLKYYFTDIGLRNARLNFRQQEETHIMENVIYNELIIRKCSVDVGVVEINELQENGKYVRKQLEADFVVNRGNQRIYIQSALSMLDREKHEQESRSLRNINDSFKKVIIVKGNFNPWYDENGIYIISLRDFLLSDSLDF